MDKNSKIYLAGHTGLVGSALHRKLQEQGFNNIVFRTHQDLDLLDQHAVEFFFVKEKPEYVFLAAAKVGGIVANNTYPADFIYSNLLIQSNVIHHAYKSGVKKLLFLGSSCIYPKNSSQPMKEEYLLSGYLEPTNEPYAVAKIAGIKMCQSYNRQYGTNFIAIMPTNLYGPNDNFDLETSHVLPALIRKFHEAKIQNKPEVQLWGTGLPRREFLHVDDMAEACIFLMQHFNPTKEQNARGEMFKNVGVGSDITVKELADLIKEATDYGGEIKWDKSRPDGVFQKLLDSSKINRLGWKSNINLKDGIQSTYKWYKSKLD
jgi:GDP-L-fucose synthase